MDDLFKDVEEMKPDGEQPLHFYYNREERLKKASPQVQEYYNGGMKPVTGFKVFFLKQNRYIFLTLILLTIGCMFYSCINKTRNAATISDVNFTLNAFSYDEEVYMSIEMKRSKKAKEAFPVPIEAQVFLIENNNQVYDKKQIDYVYSGTEEDFLRAKFTDYDIIRIDVILKAGDQEKELSAKVEQR